MTQKYTLKDIAVKHDDQIIMIKGGIKLSKAGAEKLGYEIEWVESGKNKYVVSSTTKI